MTELNLRPVNSTSYVDMLGILVGIDRLPSEAAAPYLERLERAVASSRGADYQGLLDQLAISLNLPQFPALRVSANASFDLAVSFGCLAIGNHQILLLSLTSDDFWSWKKISDVAGEIRALGYDCQQLGPDGPSLMLARQANSSLVSAEEIAGTNVRLSRGRLVDGSLSFNLPVPEYQLGSDGCSLHFLSALPDGCQATYRFRVCPYTVVGSPVSALSLADPSVRQFTAGSNGRTIYQVREYLQEVLRRDRSYWGK